MKIDIKKPLILTTLISITLLSGCGGGGDKEQSSGGGDNQQATGGGDNQQATGGGGNQQATGGDAEAKQGFPIVKGFQLGMSAQDLCDIINGDKFKKFAPVSHDSKNKSERGVIFGAKPVTFRLEETEEIEKFWKAHKNEIAAMVVVQQLASIGDEYIAKKLPKGAEAAGVAVKPETIDIRQAISTKLKGKFTSVAEHSSKFWKAHFNINHVIWTFTDQTTFDAKEVIKVFSDELSGLEKLLSQIRSKQMYRQEHLYLNTGANIGHFDVKDVTAYSESGLENGIRELKKEFSLAQIQFWMKKHTSDGGQIRTWNADKLTMNFYLNNDEKLEYISWTATAPFPPPPDTPAPTDAIEFFWNAGGVSSQIFAQKFADAYKIPQFESKVDDEINHYWFYQDPKIGFKVEIYTSGQDPETASVKRIVMQKIKKVGDTNFGD